MINHKTAFESLILGGKRFFPAAFHYLPWDYALLNTQNFNSEKARLIVHAKADPLFKAALQQDLDLAEREPTEANLVFLIEELVIAHLLTEKEVKLPHCLANEDGWRLLCYPSQPPAGLVYLWKKNLLGNRNDFKKSHQLFARSFYNTEERLLIDFSLIRLEESMELEVPMK